MFSDIFFGCKTGDNSIIVPKFFYKQRNSADGFRWKNDQAEAGSGLAIAGLFIFFLEMFVLTDESVNTSLSIHEFLLASKKGMTGRAYFDFNFRGFCWSGINHVATGTFNLCGLVFWMYVFSHYKFLTTFTLKIFQQSRSYMTAFFIFSSLE